MSLKKLLCNPPAEMVAMHGDMKVCGMFEGAGEGLEHIQDENIKDEFAKRIVAVEEAYMSARQSVADNAVRAMDQIFKDMVASQKPGRKDLEATLDHLAPKEGRNF